MNSRHFDRLTAELGNRVALAIGRRTLMAGAAALAASVAGGILIEDAIAKKKHKKNRKKKKTCKDCCRENGQPCNTKSNGCKASLCLGTSFTVEAVWTSDNDHDTYLFVPNNAGAALPSPFIDYTCSPAATNCENDAYPFICVNQDANGPGDEVTTVRTLLPGTYEYWIEVDGPSPAGDLSVKLRRSNGSVVRTWSSPAIPSGTQIGWHVFDIDGATASTTSVDQPSTTFLPDGAHYPATDVCPR